LLYLESKKLIGSGLAIIDATEVAKESATAFAVASEIGEGFRACGKSP
jgi:hypothetical protein